MYQPEPRAVIKQGFVYSLKGKRERFKPVFAH